MTELQQIEKLEQEIRRLKQGLPAKLPVKIGKWRLIQRKRYAVLSSGERREYVYWEAHRQILARHGKNVIRKQVWVCCGKHYRYARDLIKAWERQNVRNIGMDGQFIEGIEV